MPFEYEYPRPAVSVDLVVLDRRDDAQRLLLIKRKFDPFRDQWALPGGFLDMEETLEQAAARELMEETSLVAVHLEQVAAFSAVHRDPRTRVISVAFLAQVSNPESAKAEDDAKELGWFSLEQLPTLAFDHREIIDAALLQSSDKRLH